MDDHFLRFERDGFCIIPGAIDRHLVDRVNHQIDAFRLRNDAFLQRHGLLVDGMLQRVVNLHLSVTSLQDVFAEAMARSADIVDRFGAATLYTSLFFELGSQQSLHRDTPYFYSGETRGYIGVWVALDDADERNGALLAVKGSHRLPDPDLDSLKQRFHPDEDVPASSTPLFEAYNEELIRAAKSQDLPVITCKVRKGDLVIWDPSTLHGGLQHLDRQRTRRSFVMHVTPQNVPMKHMDYFFHRDKPIEKMERAYFPHKGRLIAAEELVDFRHVRAVPARELGVY